MGHLSRANTPYDRFLYAMVYDSNDSSLSVLSVLARQDIDGWDEAARLARLPKYYAINSLASTIWKLESERWSPSEATLVAARLIDLLPAQGRSTSQHIQNVNDNGNFWTWVVYGAILGSLAMTGSINQQNAATPPPTSTSIAQQQHATPQPVVRRMRD